MKKTFIIFCFAFFLFSCQSISRADFYTLSETYSQKLDEKVFNFGNKLGKNVLMVIGMDRYIESIEKDINSNDSQILKEKFVNMINTKIFYSKEPNFDSNTVYKWKDKTLTLNNSNFFVIVTNNEIDFFDHIISYCKKNRVKFDYFLMDFHGSPGSVGVYQGQNSIYRANLMEKFSKIKEIKNCFNKDCSALAFSCLILSDDLNTPFAIFLKTITGISNFSASKNATKIKFLSPENRYEAAGEFEKISDILCNNLIQTYNYYKKYVKVNSIGNDKSYNITLKIPMTFLSEDYDKNKSNYYIIGHYGKGEVVFYKNIITNDIVINFNKILWTDIDFDNPKIIHSSEFSLFLEFFLEIHKSDYCNVLIG